MIGALELAGVAGVLAGLLWAPIGIAAAIGLTLLSIGAIAFHVRASDRDRGDGAGRDRRRIGRGDRRAAHPLTSRRHTCVRTRVLDYLIFRGQLSTKSSRLRIWQHAPTVSIPARNGSAPGFGTRRSRWPTSVRSTR